MSPPRDSDTIGAQTFENYLEYLKGLGLYELVDQLEINETELLEAFEEKALNQFLSAVENEEEVDGFEHPRHLPLDFNED